MNIVKQSVWRAALAGTAFVALMGAAWAQDYNQAPMLDPLVADGTLPPVADRLGANPRIVAPVSEVGVYGGTFRGGMVGGNDRNLLLKFTGYEPLLAWDRDWTGAVIPNVAESYAVNADSTRFTFTLRDGMHWSDGSPFTADDIAFFIQDILPDPLLFPSKPTWLLVDGELPGIEITSPTEFTIYWSKPNGLFISNVASVFGTQLTMLNKAYCSQFLPSYNPQAEAIAAAAGAADWSEHMVNMCGVGIENIQRWRNPDRPTIEAFLITEPYEAGAPRVAFARNPWYWKVDTASNQLPYIDAATFSVNADGQTVILGVLAGEIDFEARHTTTAANLPVYVEGQEAGNFHIVTRARPISNAMSVGFNLTSADPVKREIFGARDFRIAMSHAIDRQAMIDVLYFGVGEPKQIAPIAGSVVANDRLANQYLDYDTDLANRMLDEMGLDQRGSNGLRLMPDGRPLVVSINAIPALGNAVDVGELLVQYWQKVGIDARLVSMDRTRFFEEIRASQHDVALWPGTSGGIDALLNPEDYMPFSEGSIFGVKWGQYRVGVAGGEAPPAYLQDQWNLYEQIKASADPERQLALFQQILEISAEQFYGLGISSAQPSFAVVSNRLGNVPDGTPSAWLYPDPGPENPEQFYIKP